MAEGNIGASGRRRGSPATRGGRRGRGRRLTAPGGSWLGAEDAGVEAELVAYPDGRGEVGGRGGARRRRRAPLGREKEREREQRGGEVQGEEGKREGALGVSVARLEGRGRAAEAGGGKASSVRSPRTCLSSWQEEEDHSAPGGLGLFCQVRPR